jgi:hypothetical protein
MPVMRSKKPDEREAARRAASFRMARLIRDPSFRDALRKAGGFRPGAVLDAVNVLEIVQPDGRGGWKATGKITPARVGAPPPPDGCCCGKDHH